MRCSISPVPFPGILVVPLLLSGAIATPFRSSEPKDIAKVSYLSSEASSHNTSDNYLPNPVLGQRSLATRSLRSDVFTTKSLGSNFYHPHVRPEHFHRHDAVMYQMGYLHPNITERSLALGLTVAGFQLLWQHMDIIVAARIEYYRTTDFYQKIILQLPHGEWQGGPTTQNIIITYGVFKLVMTCIGLNHELSVAFVEDFANLMLALLQMVTIVTYTLVAFTAGWAIWITMAIVDGHQQDLIGSSLPSAK